MKKLFAAVFILLATVNISSAARTYSYTITVGREPNEYDHTTITDAVAAMKEKASDKDNPGQIKIYPGTYVECIGGKRYGDKNLWLPEHCDLMGMGENTDDVVIQQPAGTAVNTYTVIASGNNVISNLKICADEMARNGVYLFDNCTLTDCIVETFHTSVVGEANLVVSGCNIKSGPRINEIYFRRNP